VQLLQAFDQLIGGLSVLFKDEREEVYHFPNEDWHLESIEEARELWAYDLESSKIVNSLMNLNARSDMIILRVVLIIIEIKKITLGSSSKWTHAM
jgi:hypothetical protein